jgi:hypothetical protein
MRSDITLAASMRRSRSHCCYFILNPHQLNPTALSIPSLYFDQCPPGPVYHALFRLTQALREPFEHTEDYFFDRNFDLAAAPAPVPGFLDAADRRRRAPVICPFR